MANSFFAYNLYFSSPIHIGLESIGQEKVEETIRSDTLWGAITQAWLLLFGYDSDNFFKNPPFLVSSCFPIIQGTRFFPLPIGLLDPLMDEVSKKPPDFVPTVKDLKKIRYISEDLLIKTIQGEKITLSILTNTHTVKVYPDFRNPNSAFSACIQRPRVMLDPLSGSVRENAFFYCTDEFFLDGSGLFFLASFESEEDRVKFEAALRLLGDTGLGADRSIGRGQFSFTSSAIKFPQPSGESLFYLLSLYRPSPEEVENGVMADSKSRYSLIKRFGRAGSIYTSRFRRADTWMIGEGSILPFKPKGTIPIVLQKDAYVPHNVYRYGRALTIPVSIRGF